MITAISIAGMIGTGGCNAAIQSESDLTESQPSDVDDASCPGNACELHLQKAKLECTLNMAADPNCSAILAFDLPEDLSGATSDDEVVLNAACAQSTLGETAICVIDPEADNFGCCALPVSGEDCDQDDEKGLCDDDIDNDCDTLIDCEDPDCDEDAACTESPIEICDNLIDDDLDTLVDCEDPDCSAYPACTMECSGPPCDAEGLVDWTDTAAPPWIGATCYDVGFGLEQTGCTDGCCDANRCEDLFTCGYAMEIIGGIDYKAACSNFDSQLTCSGDSASDCCVPGCEYISYAAAETTMLEGPGCDFGQDVPEGQGDCCTAFSILFYASDPLLKYDGMDCCVPAEVCDNSIDDDLDTFIDCDDPDCVEDPACTTECSRAPCDAEGLIDWTDVPAPPWIGATCFDVGFGTEQTGCTDGCCDVNRCGELATCGYAMAAFGGADYDAACSNFGPGTVCESMNATDCCVSSGPSCDYLSYQTALENFPPDTCGLTPPGPGDCCWMYTDGVFVWDGMDCCVEAAPSCTAPMDGFPASNEEAADFLADPPFGDPTFCDASFMDCCLALYDFAVLNGMVPPFSIVNMDGCCVADCPVLPDGKTLHSIQAEEFLNNDCSVGAGDCCTAYAIVNVLGYDLSTSLDTGCCLEEAQASCGPEGLECDASQGGLVTDLVPLGFNLTCYEAGLGSEADGCIRGAEIDCCGPQRCDFFGCEYVNQFYDKEYMEGCDAGDYDCRCAQVFGGPFVCDADACCAPAPLPPM